MKIAIIILSDPNNGEEALGRLFNALAAAYEFQQNMAEVKIYFQGAGTRWISALVKSDHPAHPLYQELQESIVGASCGCADVFGTRDDIVQAGVNLIQENAIPGTSGLPSLHKLTQQAHQILIF